MHGVNHYLVTVDTILQEKIKLAGGIELYFDGSYQHEWSVSVTGTVVCVPQNPKTTNKWIEVKDNICFSYQVLNDKKFTAESHIFKIEHDYPDYKLYANGNGDQIKIIKLAARHGGHFAAVCYTKRHQLIEGAEGTESDINRWLAQFPMSNAKDFVYENLVEIEGKQYWKVRKEQIFAKKIKKKLFSCSEFVICKPIVLDVSQRISLIKGIALAPGSVMTRYVDRAEVVAGGRDLGLERGDIIGFDAEYVNKYTLFDEEYFLIKEGRANVKWE